MRRSSERILTTHTGSLPRPPHLAELIMQVETGGQLDPVALQAEAHQAVMDTVRKQVETGIDIVNDGEMGKPGYSTYIKDRVTGFGGHKAAAITWAEARDFPEFNQRRLASRTGTQTARPSCDGPIVWKDFGAVERDVANLQAATTATPPTEAFMTAASPGVIAIFLANEYYPSHEAYLEALVAVMKDEYEAIHKAGFQLQIDCPDLAMSRASRYPDLSLAEFRRIVQLHVDAVNEATQDIPADDMRLHLCWGNYEGPHHTDVALGDIIDIVLQARPSGLSFEGANPRHEHEWKLWEQQKLPAGKVLFPGVIDSTTNFIEHPELVAQRILRYAQTVGQENVVASVDCGFGTFVLSSTVDPKIAWAKLGSLVEGARIASRELSVAKA